MRITIVFNQAKFNQKRLDLFKGKLPESIRQHSPAFPSNEAIVVQDSSSFLASNDPCDVCLLLEDLPKAIKSSGQHFLDHMGTAVSQFIYHNEPATIPLCELRIVAPSTGLPAFELSL